MDLDVLPEELLADILRRLPPRPIAVCRSVSAHLRAVIDGRGLLAAHLAPVGLRGIFINFVGQDCPYFFSRQAATAAPSPVVIDGDLTFLPPIGWREASHHSNGLLLVRDWDKLYVCNPTTRRWAHLPPRPEGFHDAEHLIFDPSVSLHYEVISFANVPRKPKIPIQPDIERPPGYQCFDEYTLEEIEELPSSLRAKYDREAEIQGLVEWPPSSYVAQVFSSRTGQWEERVYAREDDVAVTLSDVWSDPWGLDHKYDPPRCNAICWQGALYLHCRGGFVMRLSLLEHKYRVIKTPRLDNIFTQPRLDINDFLRREGPYMDKEACLRKFEMEQKYLDNVKPSMHLGKSEYGIYYTALIWHQLQVWVLHKASESCSMWKWELKHKADIEPYFHQHYTREDRKEIKKSWSLESGKKVSDDRLSSGWDSSDDNNINMEREHGVDNGNIYCDMNRHMDLLGYHPSKEIAFLGNRFDGFSYYLGCSKFEYLGTFYPVGCTHRQVAATHESFIYTPCMYDLLPGQQTVDTDEDEELEDETEVDTCEDEELEEDET